MSQFIERARAHFDAVTDALFQALKPGEDLTANYCAEESLFVRFNGNRVRQNTDVAQFELSLRLQVNGRTVGTGRNLSGHIEADRAAMLDLLARARRDAEHLPLDPNQVPIQHHGESSEEFHGALPTAAAVVGAVVDAAHSQDLAGLYAGGPIVRANRNSKGQRHWFATENFFLDYSLYDGPRAAKGTYAGAKWQNEAWSFHLHRTRDQLALLARPVQNVKPGSYRTYLAPHAFADLCGMLSWEALSAAAWKQGRSPFKKLADGEVKLSPLFQARENFGLGLTPRFNGEGEMAPAQLPLIEAGQLKSLLVSSRTAKEFGLPSNQAGASESPRALEIGGGTLEERHVLRELGTGLYLSKLHYLNWSDPVSARVTGMTRYACFWVEGGEIVGPIQNLRWDESLYEALGHKLVALTEHAEIDPETDTYFRRSLGGTRIPGALIDHFTFTL